jgi:hypothetical protein
MGSTQPSTELLPAFPPDAHSHCLCGFSLGIADIYLLHIRGFTLEGRTSIDIWVASHFPELQECAESWQRSAFRATRRPTGGIF